MPIIHSIMTTLIAMMLGSFMWTSSSAAQSVNRMLGECSRVGQGYFRVPDARTDMRYNGLRTDRTHAINGRIFLETRFEDFACSYRRDGQRMVEFVAEGRVQSAYPPGGGESTGSGDVMRVTGVASNDVLNVRSGPGTSYRIVGALSNGSRVRNLRCQTRGSSRWCEIEMQTDMRERGWVNARYLAGGTAVQQPSPPPSTDAGGTRTVRVRFPAGSTGTELRDRVAPGASIRFVLGARSGQNLYTRVAGDGLTYQILLPNGRFLLEQMSSVREYRGQLSMSGEHVVEVINRTSTTRSFNIIMGVD